MEKTSIQVGTDYMDFVYKFHNTLLHQKISLVYEGEVNQDIVKVFTAMTEKNMTESEAGTKATKRLYHVMVECMQNICKHTYDPVTGEIKKPGEGIVMLGEKDEGFTLTTGNTIVNDKIESMKATLDELNSLDPDELKLRYKQMIRESTLSEKAGAGLGFIDIIKKTGNKVEYHFVPMNDKTSFFIFSTKVDRV